jgi:RNA polymerase sigma factor (sigma-70 family)
MQRDQIIKTNIPFVHYMAKKLSKRWYHELVCVGYEKLITVVDRVIDKYPDQYNNSYIIASIQNKMRDWLDIRWIQEVTGIEEGSVNFDCHEVDFIDFISKKLTFTEALVLQRILEGYKRKEIAELLDISAPSISRMQGKFEHVVKEYLN